MAFYPFLHLYTVSPEEKLNLVVNKAILILTLRYYLPTIPPVPSPPCLVWKNIADIKHVVNQVHIYICLFFILYQFLYDTFLDKTKSDKSQKMSNSVPIHSDFVNMIFFRALLIVLMSTDYSLLFTI